MDGSVIETVSCIDDNVLIDQAPWPSARTVQWIP